MQTHNEKKLLDSVHLERHAVLLGLFTEAVDLLFSVDSTTDQKELQKKTSILDLARFLSFNVDKEPAPSEEGLVRIIELRKGVDELVADWIMHQEDRSGVRISRTSIQEVMTWGEDETRGTTDVLIRGEKITSEKEAEKEARGTAFPDFEKNF